MTHVHVRYLIVGGGVAASEAARAIRSRDAGGSVLLVGQEATRPYHRPPLSKQYLSRQSVRADLSAAPIGFYADQHIELRTGRRATQIDTARHAVTLDSGEVIAADAILLAVGSVPKFLKVPGAELPNTFYLRNLDDADRLINAIEKAKNEGRPHARGKGRAAVVGGGVLGPELAGTLSALGLHVDLVVAGPYPWWKWVGETIGKFAGRALGAHGVAVHEHVRAARFDGDGRVQRIVLTDGRSLDCDFVVAATGVNPNREILRNTPINAERAILADAFGQTNIPGIFAAGDCAAVFDPLFDKHRIVDHWDHARRTGELAGLNMAASLGHGERVPFSGVTHFTSTLFGLELHVWGESRLVHHRLVRGHANGETADVAEIGLAEDGRVVQAAAIGRTGEHAALCDLIATRANLTGREESVKDPAVAL
jgi:3-phenylpropionate/trans-cinnamate dioxygenase ferredoxin reductase subunit